MTFVERLAPRWPRVGALARSRWADHPEGIEERRTLEPDGVFEYVRPSGECDWPPASPDRAARVRSLADAVTDPVLTLFHRIAEPGSARTRQRVVELGLTSAIDFQNAETDGSDALARLGGSVTPALWDGHTLTVGEGPVGRRLAELGPHREDGG